MSITALTLILMRFLRPGFKYPWILAASGAGLSLISIFLWQIHMPQSISLGSWQPATLFFSSPSLLADRISWPYALSLATLSAAVIWTSVVRSEKDPVAWAGILLLAALGILAVAAENPLTLILVWTAIDVTELVIMLRSTEGAADNQGVVIAFASRMGGTALVMWAALITAAGGAPLNFSAIPSNVGIFLLMAVGLRLGVLPLHLPYRKETNLRRGVGTSLRLVSAAASLSLLAHIPAIPMRSTLTLLLILLAGITAVYSSWMWLRASDEILGRPFWVLGMASLSVAASLNGNPIGSIGWGVLLIIVGGLLFLFSARQRSILWLPLIGVLELSSLPFTVSASGWQTAGMNWLFGIPFLVAQALLIAGFFRHSLHPGETSLESQDRWVKVLYPAGLAMLAITAISLGFWGWGGAHLAGLGWQTIVVDVLAVGIIVLVSRFMVRLKPAGSTNQWSQLFRLEWLYKTLSNLYSLLQSLVGNLTSSFEGEGGLLWSFLLLVLFLSVLSTFGH